MLRLVRRDRVFQKLPSLLRVAKGIFCCLCVWGIYAPGVSADPIYHLSGTVSSDQSDDNQSTEEYGVPIFKIDDMRWFDITIDLPDHPESAQEVEEQRNRDSQSRKSGRPAGSPIFPDTNEITEGIRFRFHYRFD